jgi:hypothetical protein
MTEAAAVTLVKIDEHFRMPSDCDIPRMAKNPELYISQMKGLQDWKKHLASKCWKKIEAHEVKAQPVPIFMTQQGALAFEEDEFRTLIKDWGLNTCLANGTIEGLQSLHLKHRQITDFSRHGKECSLEYARFQHLGGEQPRTFSRIENFRFSQLTIALG